MQKKETLEKTNAELILGTWQSKTETTIETIGGTTNKKVNEIHYLKLTFDESGQLTYSYSGESSEMATYSISGNVLIMGDDDPVIIKSLNSSDLNLILEKEDDSGTSYEYSMQFVKE